MSPSGVIHNNTDMSQYTDGIPQCTHDIPFSTNHDISSGTDHYFLLGGGEGGVPFS